MEAATPRQRASLNPVPSSSPAFATPAHPVQAQPRPLPQGPFPRQTSPQDGSRPPFGAVRAAPVLPIILPPATLRPVAFRTFTKKHNLTLTSSALQSLSTFIGRHCGSRWREDGLAEMTLEEVARSWKKGDGKVIVDGEGERLKLILKQVEGSMVGGRVTTGIRSLSRESTATSEMLERLSTSLGRPSIERDDSQDSLGMSALGVEDPANDDDGSKELRGWLQVVSAFDQPRLLFNPTRKHFDKSRSSPSLFSPVAQRTEMFHQRYHLIHQRLQRNESFQPSTIGRNATQHQTWKVTPIANLLGRSGSGHLLLGLLQVAPTGQVAISDLTGTVILDLEQASQIDEVETWVCPGMIVLVDGVYEEDSGAGSLSGAGGVGGTISGRFVGFSIGAPRCETRAQSLGLSDAASADKGTIGGGFGWVDFLGVGSERAAGTRMRRLEQQLLVEQPVAKKFVVLGDVALDEPRTVLALRRVFSTYAAAAVDLPADEPLTSSLPAGFVLFGSFTSYPALSSQQANDGSSVTYKENFDVLAALLHDFPILLRHCTFIFVPGDKDAWPSAFAAGAASPIPQSAVPDMFTTRIKREFAAANADSMARERELGGARESIPGQAIWTSNPSRVTLFGPCHEIVLFRDDASGRLRRNTLPLNKQHLDEEHDADSGISMSEQRSPASSAMDTESHMSRTEDTLANPRRDHTASATQPELQHARRLTKTLLDQTHLSPYALSSRPVHWSYGHALSLFPLPSALFLCDADAGAFSLVYQECCVVNAGRLVGPAGSGSARDKASWVEYDLVTRRGGVREALLQ